MIHDLPTRRVRATPENFRDVFGEAVESSAPHKLLHGDIRKALKRARVPESINIPNRAPQISSPGLFDYEGFGEYPMGFVERVDMPIPMRGLPGAMAARTLKPDKLDDIISAIRSGAERGGGAWYDMNPIYRFADRNAREADVAGLLDIMAPMSQHTNVPREILQGTFANQFRKKYGRMPTLEDLREARTDEGAGLGMILDDKARALENLERHGSLEDEPVFGKITGMPKVEAYRQARRGNLYNPVIDSHMLKNSGELSENSSPQVKGALAMLYQELAARSGLLPPQAQAAPWVHWASRPKVGPSSPSDARPFANLFESLVHEDAKLRGKDSMRHMVDVLEGNDWMQNLPKGFAGGGLARAIEYLSTRLPSRYRGMPITPVTGGTGRKVFLLGDDPEKGYVAKLARLPRGIHENDAAGQTALERAGLMPRLDYRSPNSELIVSEKIPRNERTKQLANSFAEPMHDMTLALLHNPYAREGIEPARLHAENPDLSRMLTERNLDPFKRHDVLLGDFTKAASWGFRKHSYLQPTLLDEGALVPDLLTKQKNAITGNFMEILERRKAFAGDTQTQSEIKEMLAAARRGLDTGEEYGLTTGHIHGFAGGGPVRNWLRLHGKPFESGFDKIISTMKRRALPHGEDRERIGSPLVGWIDRNFSNYLARDFPAGIESIRDPRDYQSIIRKIPAAEVVERGPVVGGPGADALPWRATREYMAAALPPWLKSLREQDMERHLSQKNLELANWGAVDRNAALSGEAALEAQARAGDKYMRRHAPKIEVHDYDWGAWRREGFEQSMNDMLDYLRHQNYTPEQLSKVSVPQALKGSADWHAAMAKKAEEQRALARAEGMKPVREYPSGHKWVTMGEGQEEDAMDVGKALGHCYQNPETCREYLSTTKLHTLFDPKGVPKATLEVRPGLTPQQIRLADFPTDIVDEFMGEGNQVGGHTNGLKLFEFARQKYPDLVEKLTAPSIGQVRGRQGGGGAHIPFAPETMPYVQDYIKNNKWSDINELHNADLIEHVGHYLTTDDIKKYGRIPMSMEPTKPLSFDEWVNAYKEAKLANPESSALLDWQNAIRRGGAQFSLADDFPGLKKPEGFAAGGAVTSGLDHLLIEAEQMYQLPPGLVGAVADIESGRNPKAKGKKGEIGVMQLMPGTAKYLGVKNPEDPKENILGGARYLAENLKKFGTLEKALAAYNWGPGRVGTYGMDKAPASTREYISKVFARLGKDVKPAHSAPKMDTLRYAGPNDGLLDEAHDDQREVALWLMDNLLGDGLA